MRYLNRYILLWCALFLALSVGTAYAAHMYYIGVLSSISNEEMIVDGKNYHLAPKAKVVLHTD